MIVRHGKLEGVKLFISSKSPYQLLQLWHHTDLLGEDIAEKLLESFDKRISEIYLLMEEEGTLKISESPGLKVCLYKVLNLL